MRDFRYHPSDDLAYKAKWLRLTTRQEFNIFLKKFLINKYKKEADKN